MGWAYPGAGGVMPYLFCLVIDLAAIACVGWIGWLVWHGASVWLVLAMPLLALSLMLPGRDVFTCPKCGHAGEVKVFKAGFDAVTCVQKDKGTPED